MSLEHEFNKQDHLDEIREEHYRALEKLEVIHQPWCAKVIAMNAMLPYNVRCDCQKKPKTTKRKP